MFENINKEKFNKMDEAPVAVRLKSVIESLGLSDSQFADSCSISRPTLSLLLSGKNKKISDIMLSQIHQAFPQISILWLLFGEGEMYKKENKEYDEADINDENQKFRPSIGHKEEELNLVNIKQLENIIQDVVNKSFEAYKSTVESTMLKITEANGARKVSEITIYYDDSTFETFIPEKI